jgi:hypothetical protein
MALKNITFRVDEALILHGRVIAHSENRTLMQLFENGWRNTSGHTEAPRHLVHLCKVSDTFDPAGFSRATT